MFAFLQAHHLISWAPIMHDETEAVETDLNHPRGPLTNGRWIEALLRRHSMIWVLGWMLFGLIVGVIAKLVMPGRDPGGIFVTMLIGVVGAVLGGFLGRAVGWYQPGEVAGFVVATLGAILLLFIYRKAFRPV
jgi:uncharacterized membrane protein YeaQ/YmgE (transglycosylase-associated protein family)